MHALSDPWTRTRIEPHLVAVPKYPLVEPREADHRGQTPTGVGAAVLHLQPGVRVKRNRLRTRLAVLVATVITTPLLPINQDAAAATNSFRGTPPFPADEP
jgi:hypothetical protein